MSVQQHFNEIAEMLADGKITPERACSLIEDLRDAEIFPDDILEPEKEEQKCFNEIASVFAEWKITTEETCELFEDWKKEKYV